MKITGSKNWFAPILTFLALLVGTIVYLSGLIVGMLYFDQYNYGGAFIVIYLTGSTGIYLWKTYRGSLTRQNFSELYRKMKQASKDTIKLLLYLILALIVLALLFLVGGWVASLSASTIIIILLILILFK